MGALLPCTVARGPVDQVGCSWSWQTLPWVMRELGAEQRGDFITGPHPALDFSLGFVILCPTPCPQALGTAPVGTRRALSSHTPSPGPEPPFLGPSHQAGTLGSLGSNLRHPTPIVQC